MGGHPAPAPEILDNAYADPALVKIRAAVKGNGCDENDVVMESLAGEIATFPASLSLSVQVNTSARSMPGKKTGNNVFPTAQAMQTALDKDVHTASGPENSLRIQDLVLQRSDRGFAMKEDLPLPFLDKEYIRHEGCRTCNTQGELRCQRCFGKGYEVCPRCNGQGQEICRVCNGAQYTWAAGKQIQCMQCSGMGRAGCTLCNQRRRIPCKLCGAKGASQCSACKGQGWNSHVTYASFFAKPVFDYRHDALPEKLRLLLERPDVSLKDHAEITVQPPPAQPRENRDAIIEYAVRVPFADMDVNFGKDSSAHFLLLGPQADIIQAPSFLDPLLKSGIDELKEAAAGHGDISRSIQRAARYRILRHALLIAPRYSKTKATRLLLKNYSLGLSPQMAATILEQTGRVIGNITATPEKKGILAGLAAALAVYAVWLFSPLRATLTAAMPQPGIYPLADTVTVICGIFIAAICAQAMIGRSLKVIYEGILPAGKKISIMPRGGRRNMILAALCLLLFLLMLEIALHAGVAPEWYLDFRNRF